MWKNCKKISFKRSFLRSMYCRGQCYKNLANKLVDLSSVNVLSVDVLEVDISLVDVLEVDISSVDILGVNISLVDVLR
jgi:hypothetical protein